MNFLRYHMKTACVSDPNVLSTCLISTQTLHRWAAHHTNIKLKGLYCELTISQLRGHHKKAFLRLLNALCLLLNCLQHLTVNVIKQWLSLIVWLNNHPEVCFQDIYSYKNPTSSTQGNTHCIQVYKSRQTPVAYQVWGINESWVESLLISKCLPLQWGKIIAK